VARTLASFSAVNALVLAAALTACGGQDKASANSSTLEGTVLIDGSSTVFPITEAVAEEFGHLHPRVRVTVGVSGTGGGMKKFSKGETAVSGASRPIKQREIDACAEGGVEFVELPVAYDGLAVVVNAKNDFVKTMTVDELAKMWQAGSQATTWRDIRSDWPDRAFRLYAPGQDSGTFDYFTETVNGKSGNCRPDATFSEDDNVLVRGVSGDGDGIGFFGFAYYHENKDLLNVVGIDGGNGAVVPSLQTIEDGSYAPLSRPLFVYVSTAEAKRPAVDAFMKFYLGEGRKLAEEVGYVPLPSSAAKAAQQRYEERMTGAAQN
jgi:phosphate transport system substrate-binding protein